MAMAALIGLESLCKQQGQTKMGLRCLDIDMPASQQAPRAYGTSSRRVLMLHEQEAIRSHLIRSLPLADRQQVIRYELLLAQCHSTRYTVALALLHCSDQHSSSL